MIRESWGHSLDEELDLQRDAMRELGFGDDYREGVAAFMEKRKPNFTGKCTRHPAKAGPRETRRDFA